ncbi:MAG: hypothetical protein JM58_06125 [Peptococcaceae bacterium BICA1-8]|nr:MAG: hypothetical protein JM58_06125 [Peptococcaceae bacterium BICA1-8]
MGIICRGLHKVFKSNIVLILLIGLFLLTFPIDIAQAHIGSMTKTVNGNIFKLSGQPVVGKDSVSANTHRYTLSIERASGEPVSGAMVKLEPLENEKPQGLAPIALQETTDTGSYTGTVDFPSQGQWKLRIIMEQGNGRSLVEFTDRIVSQPNSGRDKPVL